MNYILYFSLTLIITNTIILIVRFINLYKKTIKEILHFKKLLEFLKSIYNCEGLVPPKWALSEEAFQERIKELKKEKGIFEVKVNNLIEDEYKPPHRGFTELFLTETPQAEK